MNKLEKIELTLLVFQAIVGTVIGVFGLGQFFLDSVILIIPLEDSFMILVLSVSIWIVTYFVLAMKLKQRGFINRE